MTRLLLSLALVALCSVVLAQQPSSEIRPGDVGVINSADKKTTEFTIITAKGFVGFSVGAEWSVIAMQSKLPVASAGFQIPNLADENTNDSTNLAITLYDETTPEGREALGVIGRAYGQKPPRIGHRKNWTIYSQESKQGDTAYSVLDAKSEVADVTVAIRLAWPHLSSNSADYDKRMKLLFESVMGSVHGGIGPYKRRPDEVIQRPTQ